MTPRPRWTLLTTLLLGGTAGAVVAQTPLGLSEALARAERAAYPNRIAAGRSTEQAGRTLAPLRGILPSLRLEAGYLRTTDPLNAFGFTLRQRSVTPAAFAPDRLNDPDAIGDVFTGLVLEQPLLNPDAWLGRRAARQASSATSLSEAWTRSATALDVVRAYWGAVLSAEQVRALEAAHAAARAHVSQAEALVRRGMVTRSDALLAQVKAGEVESRLIAARSRASLARRQLAVAMGDPADTAFTLPAALPDSGAVRILAAAALADSGAVAERADVRAAIAARGAARSDASRASSLYLPRLNGYGRLDWNDPDTPFGGKSAWTLGVMLSWSPFTGASELAEARAANGRRDQAEAQAQAAQAQAELEVADARDQLTVALARMEIAERAVSQAAEAHRIVARKYDGGLATVTELFDAAAAQTASDLGLASSRYDVLVNAAAYRRATGRAVGSEE
jgi:outer membrane protein TolC